MDIFKYLKKKIYLQALCSDILIIQSIRTHQLDKIPNCCYCIIMITCFHSTFLNDYDFPSLEGINKHLECYLKYSTNKNMLQRILYHCLHAYITKISNQSKLIMLLLYRHLQQLHLSGQYWFKVRIQVTKLYIYQISLKFDDAGDM